MKGTVHIMKRLLSLLLLLSLLFSTVSCADILGGLMDPPPSGTQTPSDPNTPSDGNNPSPTPTPTQPTPPPVILPGTDADLPTAVSASYHLVTDEDNYRLYALYRTEDGAHYSVTREGTYTLLDGLYILTTDADPLYGVYHNGTFYLTDETGADSLPSSLRGGDGVTVTDITPVPGNRSEGYRDLSNNTNGANMQALYREMLDACNDFLASDATITDENYAIAVIDYTTLGLTKDEALAVWKIFTLENPAYYWLSTSVYTSSTSLYLCIDKTYAAPATRRQLDVDIYVMVAEARALVRDGMRDLEIALALHDFILDRIDYSYINGTKEPETAIWAHNIIGASSVGGGVCETYAKTFHFLGTILGLDVLTVSGDAGEPHAWNLVRIGNEWYGVDLTWDDTKEQTHAYTHFGMGADLLAKDHTPDTPYGAGANYLYALPTVSEVDIALVTLYENGVSLGIYAGIDDAMLRMTNETADYRIDLFNYAFEGEHHNAYPELRHRILSATTPKVKSITLTGGIFILDRYRESTSLYFVNTEGFTLKTDLSLEDAIITSELPTHTSFSLGDHTLTFTGTEGGCDLSFLGTRTEGSPTVNVRTEKEVTLNVYVRLADVNVESGTLVLAGGAEITAITGADLRIAPDDTDIPYDYRIASVSNSGPIKLLLSDGASLYLADVTSEKLSVELAFEDESSFPNLVFTKKPSTPVSITVDGNVDDDTVATPINLLQPIATFPTDMTMEDLDVSFTVWYSKGGVIVNRSSLFEIKNDGKLQTIDYNIVENSFVMKDDILLLYIGDDTSVTVPTSVREIYPMAFLGLDNLESVTLNEGVEIIQPSAFLRCPKLASIYLPHSLSRFSATFAGSLAPSVSIHYNGTLAELRSLLSKNGITAISAAFTFICKDGTL